ncbi:hypothetical protein ACTHGU_12605 [Chitinophagaceae bacterium MMS25-I14]
MGSKISMIIAGTFFLHCGAKAQGLKDVSFYLGSKCVPAIAKDYYANKFEAGDNHRSFAIADSMWTNDCSLRPFYLLLVSNMLVNADGQLSDTLGIYCKKFIETHPDELLEFLNCGNRAVNPDFIQHWSYQIAGEIMSCDRAKAAEAKNSSLQTALSNCRPENREKLERLYNRIFKFCI